MPLCKMKELPPRARRIPTSNTHVTTNTVGNYLRVRGEYFPAFSAALFTGELPPRARRIRPMSDNYDIMIGTTSACAENTTERTHGFPRLRNYLRVRGEYPK